MAELDFTKEYLLWDNRENVTLLARTREGDTITVLDSSPDGRGTCKRRQLTWRELQPSAGAYTTQDRAWLVPVDILPSGITPKPGDRILDSSGTSWTILEGGLNTWQTWYRFLTRNFVLAYDLRDSIDIYRPENTQDEAGNRVPVFPTTPVYAAIPGKVFEQAGSVEERLAKKAMQRTFTAFLGQPVTVTGEDQVRANGVIYQITGYRNPESITDLMELTLEIVA